MKVTGLSGEDAPSVWVGAASQPGATENTHTGRGTGFSKVLFYGLRMSETQAYMLCDHSWEAVTNHPFIPEKSLTADQSLTPDPGVFLGYIQGLR